MRYTRAVSLPSKRRNDAVLALGAHGGLQHLWACPPKWLLIPRLKAPKGFQFVLLAIPLTARSVEGIMERPC